MLKEKNLITVGVLEGTKPRLTYDLMKDIFTSMNYKLIQGEEKEFMCLLIKDDSCLSLINLDSRKVLPISNLGIQFNIIIHTCLQPEDYQNKEIKDILRKAEYLLINSDEKEWTLLIEGIDKPIVISYGFNNKATVNLSSYNIDDILEANICFQRKVCAINGNLIEPFEFPIKINNGNKVDIYSVIGIISCGLVMGVDISSLKTF